MKKLSGFLLLTSYMLTILFITAVGVKAYIGRMEKKSEEEMQNMEEVIAGKAYVSYKSKIVYEQPAMNNSYEKTLKINKLDKKYILENQYDFSKVKIACLGDSITEATNLKDEENYQQYSYPSILKDLLGAKEVYNLGIGGSSIGRYWFEPFVDRYMEIPKDSDIIIVMGGINDGFCASEAEFGNLTERARRTFCGDLDELMRGLKEDYPDTVVFFATPLSSIEHDNLMRQNEKLLEQEKYVEVIRTLSEEYGFEFVDLYDSGILDSHDADILKEYMSDSTHGNHEGYRILAEHFAKEIINYYIYRGVEKENGRRYERRISAMQ